MMFRRKSLYLLLLLFLLSSSLFSGMSHSFGLIYQGYGANRVVSGSLHLIRLDGDKIILDAGAFFGQDGKGIPPLPSQTLSQVRGIFITHAHTDHVGRLLDLRALGYTGPIYSSLPTVALLPVMLSMSARYGDQGEETFVYSRASWERNKQKGRDTPVHSQKNCPWLQRIKGENRDTCMTRRSLLQEEGFYLCSQCVEEEVQVVMQEVIPIPLGEPFSITERIILTTYLTPHIPGSVMVLLEGKESGHTLLYTGDLGSGLSPFLPPQEEVAAAHWILLEGTYGPGTFPPDPWERDVLLETLGRYLEEGRRIIIPAFVLDRTQQLLYELYRGKKAGLIPWDTPIGVLGTTALTINTLYRKTFREEEYAPYFSPSFLEEGPYPINLYTPISQPRLLEPGEIIITSPGMAETGYARELIETHLQEEDVVILFVGYLDGETFGGELMAAVQEGEEGIWVGETWTPVEAVVKQVRSFQGHATPCQIKAFLSRICQVEGLLLVHTSYPTGRELKGLYEEAFPGIQIEIPAGGIEYPLPVPVQSEEAALQD